MLTRGRVITGLVALTLVGCAAKTPPETASAAAAPSPAATTSSEGADQLADGPGKRVLTSACTVCHGLREVTKFRGFYTRPQWRDIVLTMVDYGAPVDEKQIDLLADYLTQQLGRK